MAFVQLSGLPKAQRVAVARLSGCAMRHASGRGEGEPIAELHEISTDPVLLGLAAAGYVHRQPGDEYGAAALELLRAAGADEQVLADEAERIRARRDRLGPAWTDGPG